MELIDTCWNVNLYNSINKEAVIWELIDTCWNVNLAATIIHKPLKLELIDTCWNVNSVCIAQAALESGN